MGHLSKVYGATRVAFIEDFKNGMSYKQLSEKYNISKSTVGYILLQCGLRDKKPRY